LGHGKKYLSLCHDFEAFQRYSEVSVALCCLLVRSSFTVVGHFTVRF